MIFQELVRTKKWIYLFIFFWLLLILAMGGWWLYIILHFSKSQELSLISTEPHHLISMMKWEGLSFFILLILLVISVAYLFLIDTKRTLAMQKFFAAFSHEMKTPLTSIQLQAEVLQEKMHQLSLEPSKSHDLFLSMYPILDRLIFSGQNLKKEVQKLLQLSRIELGAKLHPTIFSLPKFLSHWVAQNNTEIPIVLESSKILQENIFVDPQALEVIFNNLLQNTKRHHVQASQINITLKSHSHYLGIIFDDNAPALPITTFKKLARIFESNDPQKGSGIGLYLCTKLIYLMKGKIIFHNEPHFFIEILFPYAYEELN